MIPITPSPFAPRPALTERGQLEQAATRFEAIFARQMLSAARKAGFGDELIGGQGLGTFRQLLDERFADILAERGSLGLGAMIENQLSGSVTPAREGK